MSPTPQQLETLERIALGAILLGLFLFALRLPGIWSGQAFDVAVYWEAGARMRAGGAELYAVPRDPLITGGFLYPPTFAALFAPLTWLPRGAGYGVWALVQLAALPAALLTAARLCGVERDGLRRFALVLLLAIAGPAWVHLLQGQVNLLIIACVMLGLHFVERDRPLLGGGWIGLAVQLKLLPVVLVATLLAQERWKAVAGVALGAALAHGSVLVWTAAAEGPVDGVKRSLTLGVEYARKVAGVGASQETARIGGAHVPNTSTSAVGKRLFGSGQKLSHLTDDTAPLLFALPRRAAGLLGFALAGALFLLSLALARRRREDRDARIAAAGLALLAASLGNVICWPHHLTFLVLPLAPLVARGRWRPVAIAIGAFTLLSVPSMFDGLRARSGLLDRAAIWGLPTLGVLVVYGVVFHAFWREAPAEPEESVPPRDSE